MDKDEFFERLFIKSELADNICRDMKITRNVYTELSKELGSNRAAEISEIKRSRSLYHNKKKLIVFDFDDFNAFYKWHQIQYETQASKCYYCDTDEDVISELFSKKFQHIKRNKRGKHLEIERKNSVNNLYNKDNCVLACVFCNNDKSDIFNEKEYFEYLKDRKGFLINEYKKLK